jgi:hypothetical protein
MDTATPITQFSDPGDSNNKRTRFAPGTLTGPMNKPTPYAKAKFTANVTLASLPLSIKSLAEHHVLVFLKLKTTLARLEKAKLKLADDSFTPHSARINFKLGTLYYRALLGGLPSRVCYTPEFGQF